MGKSHLTPVRENKLCKSIAHPPIIPTYISAWTVDNQIDLLVPTHNSLLQYIFLMKHSGGRTELFQGLRWTTHTESGLKRLVILTIFSQSS